MAPSRSPAFIRSIDLREANLTRPRITRTARLTPCCICYAKTSVSQATDASDEVVEIPRRNIETMRNLGREHILKRLQTLDAEH